MDLTEHPLGWTECGSHLVATDGQAKARRKNTETRASRTPLFRTLGGQPVVERAACWHLDANQSATGCLICMDAADVAPEETSPTSPITCCWNQSTQA